MAVTVCVRHNSPTPPNRLRFDKPLSLQVLRWAWVLVLSIQQEVAMDYTLIAFAILSVALVALGMSAVLRRRQASRVLVQPDASALRADIIALLHRGERAQAVKLHRKLTGSNLQDANDAVAAVARQHGL